MSKKDKKKKEKITYIDDGRTIADMSGTSGGMFSSRPKKPKTKPTISSHQTPFQTYWNAVRMMIVPMLVTLGIITVAFLLMRLLMM
jgi:hypothetical protein